MRLNRKSDIGNRKSAFTLVELLVVISIIAVLIGILIPVVGKIRVSAQETATRSLIGQIDAACQQYFGDHQAYPGPMSYLYLIQADQSNVEAIGDESKNNPINDGQAAAGPTGLQANGKRLTGTENLVLGLTGGLALDPSGSIPLYFAKDQMGLGPKGFNPKRPARSNPYMQNTNLSEGKFSDAAGSAKDTIVPEFIDSFSDPLPILYMRARKGGAVQGNNVTNVNNNVVIDTPYDGNLGGVSTAQYNILEIAPYTQSSIGVGRKLKASDYKSHPAAWLNYAHGLISVTPTATLGSKTSASQYPYDAYAYLTDPSSGTTATAHKARKQDQFVLISAGKDRVYGTEDDVTNFGNVLP